MSGLDGEFAADVRALGWIYRSFTNGMRLALDGGAYSVTESWVVSELARQDAIDAVDLRHRLSIDPGYLSRLLSRFQADRLIVRRPSSADRRRQTIRLTPRGRAMSQAIDSCTAQVVRRHLTGIDEDDRRRIVAAMEAIREAMEHAQKGGRQAV